MRLWMMYVWTCIDDRLKWMKSDEKCNSKPLPSPLLHRATLVAMDAAVMWEEELSSVDATPLSFFSSSSSSHCTPLSSVWRQGELLSGGERGGGGDGRSSSSSAASFTFTTASRRRSMACGSAGRMNWKHSWKRRRTEMCKRDRISGTGIRCLESIFKSWSSQTIAARINTINKFYIYIDP